MRRCILSIMVLAIFMGSLVSEAEQSNTVVDNDSHEASPVLEAAQIDPLVEEVDLFLGDDLPTEDRLSGKVTASMTEPRSIPSGRSAWAISSIWQTLPETKN